MQPKIFEPGYWKRRVALYGSSGNHHHMVYKCTKDQWLAIEQKHKEVLNNLIPANTVLLDFGCAWGRLLDLLPERFNADEGSMYIGIDLSPDFIDMARRTYGQTEQRRFYVCNMLEAILPQIEDQFTPPMFDIGVGVSIKQMIINYEGEAAWKKVQDNLKACCSNLLYLEYDPDDNPKSENYQVNMD